MKVASLFNLNGLTILVSGASSGIGRQVSITAASLGARIIAVGRDGASLDALLSDLVGEGHERVVFDLARRDEIDDWVKQLPFTTPIHGFAHFAGQDYMRPLATLSAKAMAELYDVHVVAAAAIARQLNRRKTEADPLSFVLASSVSATRGQPGLLAYAAAKAALTGLTNTLAVELSPKGIRVNMLVIGLVENTRISDRTGQRLNSEMWASLEAKHPLGFGTVEDPAWATCFLLSPAARWITGASLAVDGGFSAA